MSAPKSPRFRTRLRPRVAGARIRRFRRHLSALSLGVVVAVPSVALALYPEPLEIPVPGAPTVVVAADINEDGLPDLVVNSPELERITVLIGLGGELFGSAVRIDTAPRRASDIVAFDVDRDGLVDVVWVDGARGDLVTFYQVAGPGTDLFRQESIAGTEEATSVEAVDRDGDGWVDVVVALRGADQLVWYRNDAGRLVEAERVDTGDGPRALALARDAGGNQRLAVLRDGFLSRDVALYDLAATDASGRFGLDRPLGLKAGDLEGDGRDEIIATDGPGRVVVLEPQGAGLIARAQFDVRPESPWSIALSRAADAERLLVAETGRGRLSLFEDDGAGFDSDAAWFVSRNVADPLYEDVDLDGFRELVLPLPEEDRLLIIEALGDGFLIPDAVESGDRPRRVAATPEGDPFPRVVSLSEIDDRIRVHSVVDSRLVFLQDFDTSSSPDEIVLYDMDGSNGVDLLLLDRNLGVQLARSNADGTFGAFTTLIATDSARDVAVGEMLATPGPEIVIAETAIEGIRIYNETAPGQWTVEAEAAVGQTPIVVRTRDLDLNGFDDVAVLSITDRLTVVLMEADGVLSTSGLPTDLSPRDLGFGFFNDDTFPDIVVAAAGASTFSLYSSLFRGFYVITDSGVEAPFGAQSVEVVDLNEDGTDDVIFGSPSSTTLSFHPVQGALGVALDAVDPIRVCEQPIAFTTMDLDQDGVLDLVAVDQESDVVVTVRSDPLALLRPVAGTLSAAFEGDSVRVQVAADARVADEFAVYRVVDDRPVPVILVAGGIWEGVDPEPLGPLAEYVLRDQTGAEIARATADESGSATSVDTDGGTPVVLNPVLRDGAVTLRFRTGGNRRPSVSVHDLRGRAIGRADVVPVGSGWFEGRWDGRDHRGRRAARGRYFVHIQSPDARLSAPITLR